MSEYEWMYIFSNNLASLMYEGGWTQRDLAEAAHMTEATLSRYLNRKRMPTVRTLNNLIYALNCEIEDLFDVSDMID